MRCLSAELDSQCANDGSCWPIIFQVVRLIGGKELQFSKQGRLMVSLGCQFMSAFASETSPWARVVSRGLVATISSNLEVEKKTGSRLL